MQNMFKNYQRLAKKDWFKVRNKLKVKLKISRDGTI